MYEVWKMESHSITVFVDTPVSLEMDVTSRIEWTRSSGAGP